MTHPVLRPVRDSPANNGPRHVHSTPPSSPSKCVPTTTPKSTPLHRRFLKEVSMSPVTPATPATPTTPATPPRTPSRAQTATPSKDRARPSNGGSASSKYRNSPATLEIGQNGFYFSCEIPAHKITPKKPTTPQRSARAGAQVQRPPSPLKNETPIKRNPARVLFGQPKRSTRDVAKEKIGTLAASPSRGSGKLSRKGTKEVPSGSHPTSRVQARRANGAATVSTCTAGAHTEEPSSQDGTRASGEPVDPKVHAEDIGCMMARLVSGSFRTLDWTNVNNSVDPIKSPVPTPLRQASQKLFAIASPSLKLEANLLGITVEEPTKSVEKHQLHSIGGKYFEEEERVESTIDDSRGTTACSTKNPAGAQALAASPFKNDNTEDDGLPSEQHSSCSSALPFHKIRPEQQPNNVALSLCLDKHVQRPELRDSPTKPKNEPRNHHRRPGTDPKVLLAIQRDMAFIGGKFRRTFDPVPSVGRNNTKEASETSTMIATQESDTVKSKVQATSKVRGRLMRCTSDTPAVRTPPLPTNALAGARDRAVTVMGLGIPQCNTGRAISTQPSRNNSAAVKEAEIKIVPSKRETPRLRPIDTALTKPLKPAVKVTSTLHRQPTAPRPTTTHTRRQSSAPVKRQTLAATAAKGPALPPATSHTTRPLKIPSPTTYALPISKTPTLTRKPPLQTPRSTTVLRTVKSQPVLPCDPSLNLNACEQQFVDAAEIANRIKQWHNEDLEKTKLAATTTTTVANPADCPPAVAPSPLLPCSKTNYSPTTTIQDASTPTEITPSTTPPGSPLQSPIPHPTAVSAMPLPTRAAATPHKPAVLPQPTSRTPGPAVAPTAHPHPALPRVPGTPRTPAPSRIATMDRNAFRTPSKAIESSLDRAIDEKLREDARRGREFTPGGQRIKELLGMVCVE